MKGPSYVVSCTWNSFPTKYVPLLVSNEDVNKQTTTHNSLTNNQASRLLSTNDLYLQELCKYWLRLFSHLNVCLRPHEVADKLAVNIHQLTLRELENGKGRGGGAVMIQLKQTNSTYPVRAGSGKWWHYCYTYSIHEDVPNLLLRVPAVDTQSEFLEETFVDGAYLWDLVKDLPHQVWIHQSGSPRFLQRLVVHLA